MSFADITPREEVQPASPRGLPLPWWAKVGAKMVLARALSSYRLRRAFGLFLHGNLDQNVARHRAFVENVLTQHAAFTSGTASAIKRIELLSQDPEKFLRVVFAQPKSLTAKVRNDLVRVLGKSNLDHLLILASDFDTL